MLSKTTRTLQPGVRPIPHGSSKSRCSSASRKKNRRTKSKRLVDRVVPTRSENAFHLLLKSRGFFRRAGFYFRAPTKLLQQWIGFPFNRVRDDFAEHGR